MYNSLVTSSLEFSSPVVVNMGSTDATVTFHAYQNGAKLGTAERTVGAGRPHAELISDLFPGASGNMYVVVERFHDVQS